MRFSSIHNPKRYTDCAQRRSSVCGEFLWIDKLRELTVLCSLFLAICLGSVQAEGWAAQFQHEQYRVFSQVSTRNISTEIKNLSTLRKSLKETLKLKLSDQPIELFIFSSQQNYKAYVGPRVPEAVNRPAVFVKGPDALWVYVVHRRGWEVDLRHEMTHAHLHGSLPYLPIWLDEGLAKYFEVPASTNGFQKSMHQNLVWRIRFRRSIRTTDLEKLNSISDVRPEHYRDSWAWVYYCLNSSAQTRQFLQSYLQKIQAEQVPGSLFDNLQKTSPNYYKTATRFLKNL